MSLFLFALIAHVASTVVIFIDGSNDATLDSDKPFSPTPIVNYENFYCMNVDKGDFALVDAALPNRQELSTTPTNASASIVIPLAGAECSWQEKRAVLQILDGHEVSWSVKRVEQFLCNMATIYTLLGVQNEKYMFNFFKSAVMMLNNNGTYFSFSRYAPERQENAAFLAINNMIPEEVQIKAFDNIMENPQTSMSLQLIKCAFTNWHILTRHREMQPNRIRIALLLELHIYQETTLRISSNIFLNNKVQNSALCDIFDHMHRELGLFAMSTPQSLSLSCGPPLRLINESNEEIHDGRLYIKQWVSVPHLLALAHPTIETTPEWIRQVLLELLPNRVTLLFLRIPHCTAEFFQQPLGSDGSEGTIASALSSQKLCKIFIYVDTPASLQDEIDEDDAYILCLTPKMLEEQGDNGQKLQQEIDNRKNYTTFPYLKRPCCCKDTKDHVCLINVCDVLFEAAVDYDRNLIEEGLYVLLN